MAHRKLEDRFGFKGDWYGNESINRLKLDGNSCEMVFTPGSMGFSETGNKPNN